METPVPQIGIMQGRLGPPEDGRFQSFPRLSWREEFSRAAASGLNCIEWIYDHYGEEVNPLATDSGVAEMLQASASSGVSVRTCCADWFMEAPLVRATGNELAQRLERLRWLLGRCRQAGIGQVTLPFVDASRIESDAEARAVAAAIRLVLPAAEETGVEIHLETALPPVEFAALLAELQHPLVRVNYDSGNSSSLGYDVSAEFAAYGSRVGSAHVKDRLKGGGTVPLGAGDADLPAFFECLQSINYHRPLVMQVARGVAGDEVQWARHNRQYIADLWVAVRAATSSGRKEPA